MKVNYNKRAWLNDNDIDSTSSIVCFDGMVTYEGKPEESMFVEIADCRGKIRLHKNTDETIEDFIFKLTYLNTNLTEFIKHLNAKLI